MHFPTFTQEKADLNITWVNGDVEIPILSTKRIADDEDGLVCYGKDKGLIYELATDENNRFVMANGAYFIKLFVHNDILGEASASFAKQCASA